MDGKSLPDWPSGDTRAVLASKRTPADLVAQKGLSVFRDRDDLDWFSGVYLTVEGVGPVMLMRHEHNPQGLTAFYVDLAVESKMAEDCLIQYFSLSINDIEWRLSGG